MTVHDLSRRRSRAVWADPRLLVGVLLVALSIAGVWFVVAAARQTEAAFVASRTIVPGETVTRDDLRVVEVVLGSSDTSYLAPDALPPTMIATRTVMAGELVPRSAVDGAEAAGLTRVVVRSAAEVPGSIGAGSAVELWSAPRKAPGEYDVPRVLVPDATVVAVTRDEGLGGPTAVALELVIPHRAVAATLGAVADAAALSVVPGREAAP